LNEKTGLMKEALLYRSCSGLLSECRWERLIELSEQIVMQFNRSSIDSAALESVFNRMNGADMKCFYKYRKGDGRIFMPTSEEIPPSFDDAMFREEIERYISGERLTDIAHIIEVLGRYTAFLPASCFGATGSGISWYDHIRLVCAVASCLYDCGTRPDDDISLSDISSRELFLLYSFDTSGIQSFIYTITSEGALKGLRARSFYLEMLMEVVVSELLVRTGLSRANLIYSGGGHAYLLLPNTETTRKTIADFTEELRSWLLDTFREALFIADGYCACSADSLSNIPAGSYREIFRRVNEKIARRKMQRYSAAEMKRLNSPLRQHERECRICHRSEMLDDSGKCSICRGLESAASAMLRNDYFTVMRSSSSTEGTLPLPFGLCFSSGTAESIQESFRNGDVPVRVFAKNRYGDSFTDSESINVGDYASASTFGELAERSDGRERLGVLRADVDDLGHAFVAGYPEELMTLSRTAAFSRLMSEFFKLYINDILRNGSFDISGKGKTGPRDAVIVYSGGDDVFIVGSWNDIIGAAVDMYQTFRSFTQGTLSISAGIGVYSEKHPISMMARSSGELEEHSKQLDGKDAVTVFSYQNRYTWDVFIEKVAGEKLRCITEYFRDNEETGSSMLYLMSALARDLDSGERLNIARFAYLLGRLRPEDDSGYDPVRKEEYEKKLGVWRSFSDSLYKWILDAEDRRQLITAMHIYSNLHRNTGKEDH